MIKSQIVDGYGTGTKLKLEDEGQIGVVVHPHPPKAEESASIPFRSYFLQDGTGTNDMRVDGSTTNVEFSILSDTTKDTYIKTLAIVIADQNATLNQFGNIGALTNGVEFNWITQDLGSVQIHEGLKSNFEFVRLAVGQPAFGNTTNSFRAGNVAGNSEGYIPTIDLSITFGLPWGVRLRQATTDRLTFKVRDNVTGVDAFNIIGYGIQI